MERGQLYQFNRMAFQRSYSKVWWGSSNDYPYPSLQTGPESGSGAFGVGVMGNGSNQHHTLERTQPWSNLADGVHSHSMGYFATNLPQSHLRTQWTYHSLDLNHCKHSDIGNLSRIQEVEDEPSNVSPLSSWSSAKRVSPGSMRSQVSLFMIWNQNLVFRFRLPPLFPLFDEEM